MDPQLSNNKIQEQISIKMEEVVLNLWMEIEYQREKDVIEVLRLMLGGEEIIRTKTLILDYCTKI